MDFLWLAVKLVKYEYFKFLTFVSKPPLIYYRELEVIKNIIKENWARKHYSMIYTEYLVKGNISGKVFIDKIL